MTEADALMADAMTEAQLQDAIIRYAKNRGYLVYHTYDSRRSESGFPDLVLAHPDGRLIFAELKSEKGTLSKAQKRWLFTLRQPALVKVIIGWTEAYQVHVWRPSDWRDGTIERVLG
jgi:hypothetical protein